MHVFTCLLRVLLFDITTSASMKHHGKWNDRTYQHTWLHLQSIPYDTCSRTILLCWCSWHQYDSCEIRQNTPRHLRKRNKLCFLFSTVLDCLGPINRLASHVFFLAPKGWLKNCKPWSIQTFLNMKRVKEKMRRDFLHRQKNLFLTQQVMLIFLTLKVKLHFHVTWVHVASRLPQLSLFSKISLDKKRINLHTDKQRLGRNGTPVLQNYRFTAITDLTDWRHDWIVFQFLWKM